MSWLLEPVPSAMSPAVSWHPVLALTRGTGQKKSGDIGNTAAPLPSQMDALLTLSSCLTLSFMSSSVSTPAPQAAENRNLSLFPFEGEERNPQKLLASNLLWDRRR
jgi:hypothetical protein